MARVLLGLNLQPDAGFLRRTRCIAEELAHFWEVTPQTLWRAGPCAAGSRDELAAMARRAGKPLVGHGIGLSLGTPADARQERWLRQIADDHRALAFRWYSEHLGFTAIAGRDLQLPLPLPMTTAAVDVVAENLRRLARALAASHGDPPPVAFENSAFLFSLGDPRREPEFLNEIAAASGAGLLLDLHNAFANCRAAGLDLTEWLAALDLRHVVEIHLSGGSESPSAWRPSGRTFRLDSHDGPVPAPVWAALDWCLPRCPALRAVVVERIAAGLADEQVPEYEADCRRALEVLGC